MDLAAVELRKTVKSASVVKLQSLLDVVLGVEAAGSGGVHQQHQSGHTTPALQDELTFKEDLKVTMADTGLYDFLLKVVMVSGSMRTEEEDEALAKKEKGDKKDDKKQMYGEFSSSLYYVLS